MIWTADERDGFYRNPILYEDFSDPDVCLGKDAYYMTASSFSFVPGLPILKSYDLVHWRLVNYALRKIPEFRYREPIHGCGVWAPSIRFHEGRYYIVFPMPDEGLYKLETEDPEGEWSEPVKLYDGSGLIDPCPFFDEDGRVYLVNGVAKSRIGYYSMLKSVYLTATELPLLLLSLLMESATRKRCSILKKLPSYLSARKMMVKEKRNLACHFLLRQGGGPAPSMDFLRLPNRKIRSAR